MGPLRLSTEEVIAISKDLSFREPISDETRVWHLQTDRITRGKYSGLDLLGTVYSTPSLYHPDEHDLKLQFQISGAQRIQVSAEEILRSIDGAIERSYGPPYVMPGKDLICFFDLWITSSVGLDERVKYRKKLVKSHMENVKESLEANKI